MNAFSNKVAFSIGTGRCGTKFLYELLSHQSDVASHHERLPLEDSFHRYAEWNKLPIDHEGYFKIKEEAILTDLNTHDFSFESSAYLSLAVKPLYQKFNARFILLVRAPHKVITSYHKKGWYQKQLTIKDTAGIPGFQPGMSLQHHSFSRLVPHKAELEKWLNLSQIGKLAWYYQALNKSVLKQFEDIPDAHSMVVKLEDFNYAKYLEIADFLQLNERVSEQVFKKMTTKKVNTLSPSYQFYKWTDQEKEEFFAFTESINKELGYVYSEEDIAKLSRVPDASSVKPSFFAELKNKFIK